MLAYRCIQSAAHCNTAWVLNKYIRARLLLISHTVIRKIGVAACFPECQGAVVKKPRKQPIGVEQPDRCCRVVDGKIVHQQDQPEVELSYRTVSPWSSNKAYGWTLHQYSRPLIAARLYREPKFLASGRWVARSRTRNYEHPRHRAKPRVAA